jgi:hypothetical protein
VRGEYDTAIGCKCATTVHRQHVVVFAAERVLSGVERPAAAADYPAGDACDDRAVKVLNTLTCGVGSNGALCTGAGTTPIVRLFRVC